jgi:carboxylesterase
VRPCDDRDTAWIDRDVGDFVTVRPGGSAEPYRHDGGPVGALLCHGFTGSPRSLRPWAEYLADQGVTVRLPLLPGHGTRWQDMVPTTWPDWYSALERELDDLRARCSTVVAMGLSMGGTLALRLAEQRPDDIHGLVLVNPSLGSTDRRVRLVPLLKHVVSSARAIANDIKTPGVDEGAYPRTPLRPLDSLRQLWSVTDADLPKITQPILIFRSSIDHVVPAASTERVLARVSSTDRRVVVCADSYHVATLDNDGPAIFAGSMTLLAHVAAGAGAG